jgi:hypothetical protein
MMVRAFVKETSGLMRARGGWMGLVLQGRIDGPICRAGAELSPVTGMMRQ